MMQSAGTCLTKLEVNNSVDPITYITMCYAFAVCSLHSTRFWIIHDLSL